MSIQRRGEETRTRILDAALDSFGRYGYDATAVSEICRRASVTKGGFYHHFPSKQALFLEMLERWLNEIDVRLDAARSGAETIPEELQRMTPFAVETRYPEFSLPSWEEASQAVETASAVLADMRDLLPGTCLPQNQGGAKP